MSPHPVPPPLSLGRDAGAARVAALARHGLADFPDDGRLDRVLGLAAAAMRAPIAWIGLAGDDEIRIVARLGCNIRQMTLAGSLCAQTLAQTHVLMVPSVNARSGDATAAAIPALRFYAGTPLVDRDGTHLGTLCIGDASPRPGGLTPAERIQLQQFAVLVMTEIELRSERRRHADAERDRALSDQLIAAVVEAPSFQEAVDQMLAVLCRFSGAALGSVVRLAPDGAHCTRIASCVLPGHGLEAYARADDRSVVPADATVVGHAIRDQRVIVVDAPRTQPLDRYPLLKLAVAHGLEGQICIPLSQDGLRFGLSFGFAERRTDLHALAERLGRLSDPLRTVLGRRRMDYRLSLLHSIMRRSGDAVAIMAFARSGDAAGTLLAVNPALERLSGWTEAELVGRPASILHGPDTDPATLRRIADALRDGEPIRTEILNYRKDGTPIWVELDITTVTDKTGGDAHAIVIGRDVTARRRAAEQLEERAASFRLLFTDNPLPMWVYDLHTLQFLDVNAAATAAYGWSREEFLAMTILDIRPPEEHAAVLAEIRRQTTERARSGLWLHRWADGSVRQVETRAQLIEFKGRPASLIAANDVTERLAAEAALRQREDELQLLARQRIATLDSLPARVAVLDAAGRIVFTNRTWRAFAATGGPHPGAVGDLYPELCERSVTAADAATLRDILAGQARFCAADYAVDAAGERRWFRFLATPVSPEQRDGAVVMHVDITELKQTQQQLDTARQAAEAAHRAQSSFLANMSHELRTPLNAIIGFAEIMGGQFFGPIANTRYLDYVTDIQTSGHRLLSIIDDILDLSRIEADRYALSEESVELNDLLDAVLRAVEPISRPRPIRIVPSGTTWTDLWLRVDRRAMRQALGHLVINAVKFSAADTPIELRTHFDPDRGVTISIIDHGGGMSADEIEHALQPFRQTESLVRRPEEGIGLGLPLANRLVTLHGGTLTIDSMRGVGTTVRVSLPRSRVETVPSTIRRKG